MNEEKEVVKPEKEVVKPDKTQETGIIYHVSPADVPVAKPEKSNEKIVYHVSK